MICLDSASGINYIDRNPCTIETTQKKKKKAKGLEIYIQQLQCYPGISKTKAAAIAEHYGCFSDLTTALSDGSFKVKGVGPVLIAGMKEGTFFSSDPSPIRTEKNFTDPIITASSNLKQSLNDIEVLDRRQLDSLLIQYGLSKRGNKECKIERLTNFINILIDDANTKIMASPKHAKIIFE